ncbi:MAG: hypothetical protein RR743_00340 [Oscillospiraceae bacterium]
MDAIVFMSNTGYTEKYAHLLADATGIPAFSMAEAEKGVKADAEIIYMGWLMAGSVKGCKKALAKYSVRAVCAVGMAPPSQQVEDETRRKYNLTDTPVFVLQGGFNMKKLHGIYKLMMKMMANTVGKKLAAKENKTPNEIEMMDLMLNGGDRVSTENLTPVTDWFKSVS